MSNPSQGVQITLPGNTTKTDLTEMMKLAVQIIENPDQFSDLHKRGCAIALAQYADKIV
jgi:hypothetical protein